MYKIRMEVDPHECKVIVYVESTMIIFEADTQQEAKHDARRFILELLKDTGRIGY